jgi:hypothetical protein
VSPRAETWTSTVAAADEIAGVDEARHPAELLRERIEDRIAQAAEEARQLNPDEQFDRLQALTGRLNDVSSQPSMQQLTGTLQQLLGTPGRAEKPAEMPVAGEFDFATAQPHEVKKENGADGTVRYVTVLVDAQGRQFVTYLDEDEGESLYRTMQLLKSNPLAEMIYRRLVMSMLDGIIQDQKPMQANPTSPAPASR